MFYALCNFLLKKESIPITGKNQFSLHLYRDNKQIEHLYFSNENDKNDCFLWITAD